MIIGIGGVKGSGKDSLAAALKRVAESHGYQVFSVAFADALKRMCAAIDFPVEVLWGPSEARTWEHPVLQISARVMLQRLATEVGREIDPNMWVKLWEYKVNSYLAGRRKVLVLTADLRFPNEHAALVSKGAYTILVERKEALQAPYQDQHVSEQWCQKAASGLVDRVVHNDGTLEELAQQAKDIFESLIAPKG